MKVHVEGRRVEGGWMIPCTTVLVDGATGAATPAHHEMFMSDERIADAVAWVQEKEWKATASTWEVICHEIRKLFS